MMHAMLLDALCVFWNHPLFLRSREQILEKGGLKALQEAGKFGKAEFALLVYDTDI